jgi:hypothetical protein
MSLCDYQTYIKLLINKIEEMKNNQASNKEMPDMPQFR